LVAHASGGTIGRSVPQAAECDMKRDRCQSHRCSRISHKRIPASPFKFNYILNSDRFALACPSDHVPLDLLSLNSPADNHIAQKVSFFRSLLVDFRPTRFSPLFVAQMNPSLPQPIVDHYEDPFQQGICDQPTHRAEGEHSAGVTEVVVVELRVVGDDDAASIDEAWFDGEGGQACLGAASLLMEYVQQRTVSEVGALSDEMFAEFIEIEMDSPHLESCLLGLRVLREALISPLDDESGPMFSGPHLGEEC